uniref:Uncharacterized protein n=1 Tax=Tanacetum cinerariifolium TaxID=118510 RepID=A0A6L2L823_TANCI|nr:hypothetical protein [Tanacetum cinerariifolium]
MISSQVGDLSSHTTKYTSPALTQKVFANMKRVGKGFSGVDTPLFKGMIVPQQVNDDVANDVADVAPASHPSPYQSPIAPPSSPPQQQQPSQTTNISMELLNTLLETSKGQEIGEKEEVKRGCIQTGGIIAEIGTDEDVILEKVDAEKYAKDADAQGRLEESQSQVCHIDLKHADKVLSLHDDEAEPAELKKLIEVGTTAKLMTEVVTAAATTITAAPNATRRRKGVVIRDPEETSTPSIIVHSEPKSKDKEKGILFKEPKPLKKQAQIEQDEAYARKLEAELNANIIWDDVIDQVLVVDYQIHTENNKPYYKIIRADGTHQLFLSFISLLRNFAREDLEMLWQIVQEIFPSSKPKNFSDDFLLNALKTMFEKPIVEAQVWKSQRGSYGLAKVKSCKLLESCGVHIITFTTTQMILLVERRYPLTRFTLDQMLNNVRLEVEEESEVSLELLRFVRRKQQDGYRSE